MCADQLLEALNAHTVDIGLVFFELATLKELTFQAAPLHRSEISLVYHPQAFPQLAAERPLTLADLADVPLCLAEPRRYFRRYLDGHFRESGVAAKVKVESASVMQLMQSVLLGLGCAIVPQGSLLPEMTPALRFRPLSLPPMQRQAALVVAPVGKVTALAQNFFVFAQTWLAENAN